MKQFGIDIIQTAIKATVAAVATYFTTKSIKKMEEMAQERNEQTTGL